ncbi:uncharacterized protein LOC107990236 [Cynoglossus semilaevis]|uniref:uncharacterized protein LOC107990236 n=1 Tax=Cynoglossus semilaevis TaxID=244447 RepID=UPI0007DC95BC|nr:uncharacterized protein LOC107990236 [Cynoglossus semilaevis]
MFNATNPVAGTVPLAVDFDSPEDYFIFIFQLVFATTAVLTAGPIVVTILSTRALRLQNRFVFMLNTSISDTLVGLSVYYLGLFDVQEGYPYPRNGSYNILPSLLGVNLITFLFAQFDRYFAVCHPFVYTRYVTRRVIISANVYCWFHIYGHLLIVVFLPLSNAIRMYVFTIISLQAVVLTKIIMTIKLYVVARYQLTREPPGEDRENKKESLIIMIFVVSSFLVLWSPSFVNITLRLMLGKGVTFRNEATNVFAIMARLNAVSTPAVYLWGSPRLRKATMRTVWGKVCQRCKTR